jgi:hypothetical protein
LVQKKDVGQPNILPVFVLANLFLAPLALAQGQAPSARLEYTRGQGAEDCPDPTTLAKKVSERLGRNAIDEAAARLVQASVHAEGSSLVAHIELRSASGESLGERRLRDDGAGGKCQTLADAMVLSVCIAIDPLGAALLPDPGLADALALEPEPASPQPPAPPAPNKTETPTEISTVKAPLGWSMSARIPAPKPDAGWGLNLGAAVHGGIGFLPSVAPGVDLGVSLQTPPFSLALEGRLIGTGADFGNDGFVVATLWGGSLVPCLSYSGLGACVLASVGAVSGLSSQANATLLQTDFYLAAGSRLFFSADLIPGFSSRVFIEGNVPLFRPTYRVIASGGTIWEMSGISALVGISGAMKIL